MSDRSKWPRVPNDRKAGEAWDRIMRDAEEHGLILSAYGGVARLAIPAEQRRAGPEVRKAALDMIERQECQELVDGICPASSNPKPEHQVDKECRCSPRRVDVDCPKHGDPDAAPRCRFCFAEIPRESRRGRS